MGETKKVLIKEIKEILNRKSVHMDQKRNSKDASCPKLVNRFNIIFYQNINKFLCSYRQNYSSTYIEWQRS